jgi:S-formylglutathione hydrolase FrmB
MKKHSLLLIFFIYAVFSKAASVDTLEVYSSSMKKISKACIVVPDHYNQTTERLPVLYLLHGYSGNYATWVKRFPQVMTFADQYKMIIVCADGDYSSWYFDSPIDSSMRYETYISRELVAFIDQHYRTIAEKKGRGVCGLSMGGHGALYLAFRHPDVFGAAGSMSGGVDFRAFPDKWDLAKRLGDQSRFPDNWEKNTVMAQLKKVKPGGPAIMFDCGVDDFFYTVNRQLHQKMLELKIQHDYIERPGGHSAAYWSNALYYQALFFHHFFKAGEFNTSLH